MTEPLESRGRAAAALLANVLILSVLAACAALHALDPDGYYRAVQEDEALEWTTFWLFVVAGLCFGRQALHQRAGGLRDVWLPAGIALFCGLVAMEEISWGQRLIGYRPPTYFLQHNFQQELNIHNVAGSWLRKAVLMAIVLGYGVALPAIAALPRVAAQLTRVGISAPPLSLAPSFIAMALAYLIYPWSHTGEWVEQMLGAGMLFAALLQTDAAGATRARPLLRVAGAWGAAMLLGFLTTQTWWALIGGMPENLETARVELAALKRDLSSARGRTRCGIHKRLYSFARKYDGEALKSGAFMALREGGLPAERAEFFLDPWNSPYWVRHICSKDRTRRAIYVYSFGPNRLRDSMRWEVIPDDLAAWIIHPNETPESK
jgi:hypothetical protein